MSNKIDVQLIVKDDGSVTLQKVGDQGVKAGKQMSKGAKIARTGWEKTKGVFKSIIKTMFSLKGAIVGLLGGVGLAMIGKSFIKAASTAEQFKVRLTVLLGSLEEGNRMFKEMATFAGQVPFEYEQIMGAATQLSGVMAGGVEEVKEWMPIIGDLAAVTGLTIQETTGQIIRMYSAGAAAADMFRERGVLSMLGFQAGVSVSAKETRDRVIASYKDINSKFRGATLLLASTWGGLMSMMSDKWFMFRNMVMDEGPFMFLKSSLDLLNTYLEDNTEAVGDLAAEIGDKLVNGFRTAMLWAFTFGQALKELVPLFEGIGTVAKETLKLPGLFTKLGQGIGKFASELSGIDTEKLDRITGTDKERLTAMKEQIKAWESLRNLQLKSPITRPKAFVTSKTINELKREMNALKATMSPEDILPEATAEDWIANLFKSIEENIPKLEAKMKEFQKRMGTLSGEGAASTKGLEAQKKYYNNLAGVQAEGFDKQRLQLKNWMEKQITLLDKMKEEGIINQKGYNEERLQLDQTVQEKLQDGWEKHLNTIQDMENRHQLSLVKLQEQRGEVSKIESLKEQIRLGESILEQAKARLNRMNPETAAWIQQSQAVTDVQEKILNLQEQLRVTSGDVVGGIKQGMQEYKDTLLSGFQVGQELASQTAQAMEGAFSGFFFDAMQGKLKSLGDYWRSFTSSVMQMLSQLIAKMIMMKIVASALNAISPGLGTATVAGATAHTGGLIMHNGGVIPRYHDGGKLAPDERLIIGQTGERVLSRGQNARYERIMDGIEKGTIGGGDTYNVTNNVSAIDGPSVNKFFAKHGNRMVQTVLKDGRNNGPTRRG